MLTGFVQLALAACNGEATNTDYTLNVTMLDLELAVFSTSERNMSLNVILHAVDKIRKERWPKDNRSERQGSWLLRQAPK